MFCRFNTTHLAKTLLIGNVTCKVFTIYCVNNFYLDQRQLILESERRKQSITLIISSINLLKEVFLPRGFPNSVSKDYTEYQIWDTIQVK